MTIEKVLTSGTTGTFTAKIQGRPDFAATSVSVFYDGTYYHCSGMEEGADSSVFRTVYFHLIHDPSTQQTTVKQMSYIARSGHDIEKATTGHGTFTIDFDMPAQHYRMSFHAVVEDPVVGAIDILGSFDLRNE